MNRKKKTMWIRGEIVDVLFRNPKRVVIVPIANPVLRLEDLFAAEENDRIIPYACTTY